MSGAAPTGRPTIRDVARVASVSMSTVSAVINGTAPTSAETRRRVHGAIEELRFEPDGNARNLRRGRAHAIGLMVPDLVNPFFATVAEGIMDEIRTRGYVLTLCSTGFRADREEEFGSLLRTRRLDGLIYDSGTGRPSTWLSSLSQSVPVVVVDELIPSFRGAFVGGENRQAAAALAGEVLAAGHRQVAIVSGPEGLWTAEERRGGYHDAFTVANVDPGSVPAAAGGYAIDSGRAAALRLLDVVPRKRPTAILAANDLMAAGVLQAASSLGLAVPEDVSVAGFDDIPLAALLNPSLTTVRQPAQAMGARAAELLLQAIEGEDVTTVHEVLASKVIQRDSVGPPRADRTR